MKSKLFTPMQAILTIAGVTIIRAFIENFSNPEPVAGFTSALLLINYFIFYSVVVVTLGIALGIITKQSWMKMISRVTYFLPIIWLAPILDLLVTGGACQAYISTTGLPLLRDFLTFFGPLRYCGASIGIRIEIFLISISTGWYVWKKTSSAWRTIVGAIAAYTIIFFHSSVPGLVEMTAGTHLMPTPFFQNMFSGSLLGSIHTLSGQTGLARFVEQFGIFMARIPWIMTAIAIPIIAWKEYPEKFKAWLKNARVTRVIYYALLMAAGTAAAVMHFGITVPHAFPDILGYIIAIACVGLSCWLGVVINDVADQAIDAVNESDRPLVAKTLTHGDMATIGWLMGTLLLTGAILINWNFFILIVVWQIAYAIYSLPPLRMKTHYLSSSFLVGIAGTSFALAGYFLVSPDQSFATLPFGIIFAIWMTLAILSNTKDFKDVKGDRIEGIKTLPAVYGSRKASDILTWTLIAWILLLALAFKNSWIALFALPWVILDVIVKKRIPEYIRFIIIFVEIVLVFFIIK